MAELWMGAHVNAPSKVSGEGLDAHIKNFATEILGSEGREKFGDRLPYLFKVLSSKEALSIQLHPNKQEAEELHARDPEHYPDDNHKPEIAIAIEPLEALLGFDSIDNIVSSLDQHPEMAGFIGQAGVERLRSVLGAADEDQVSALRSVFTSMFESIESRQSDLKAATSSMANRLRDEQGDDPRASWFCSLQAQYAEGDVGLFCLYFLAYRTLQPGEGVFLKADVPHAYLKGTIIECMANSDNVVRAGLTPKFLDVQTLSDIVLVELEPLKVQVAETNGIGGGLYQVPVDELEVHHFECTGEDGEREFPIQSLKGARIAVCTRGSGSFGDSASFQKGDVFLLADVCSAPLNLSAGSEVFLAKPTF
jgi:mannose-6-phosphate isomerase